MYVSFVSDEHYKECVRIVLDSFNKALLLKQSIENAIKKDNVFSSDLFSNVVDPFKMRFEIQKIGLKEWIKKEILRQLDKSVEQKMGEFHQMLLGGVAGWTDLKVGNDVDLVNDENSIYIEIKNKFNTCSGDALNAVRRKLEEITKRNHQATAYWAYVIANTVQKSGEDVWVKKGFNKIEAVKKLWGEKIYEIVTGEKDALEKVYNSLPQVIDDVLIEDNPENISTIIDDIVKILEPYLEDIQSKIYSEVFK